MSVFVPGDGLDTPEYVVVLNNHTMNNMLTQLYLYNGKGLKHFKLSSDFSTVKVFEVLEYSR